MDDDATIVEAGKQRLAVGPYELLRPIGKGAVGAVWEGRHSGLGRRVAVKVLQAEHAGNLEFVARFLREGEAAARINHPNVATVYDVGQQGERVYLVMELLEGEDLGALLAREGRLPPARAIDLLLPVLAAVEAAHEVGVVHRDLKPGNIFLTRDRAGEVTPKVVDFGFSKVIEPEQPDPELTRRETALGTLLYMPLEQIRSSRTAGPPCDQYALGVTLYRCLTGRFPYEGETPPTTFAAIVRGVCPRPSELRPELPAALDDVTLRAMNRVPEGRFPSVKAFGAALLPFASQAARARWSAAFGAPLTGEEDTERASGAPARATPSPPPSTKRPLAVTLALATAALVALALVAWSASR